MSKKRLLGILICLSICFSLFAAGRKEGGGSNRGSYLAGGGFIIHPQDIFVDSYISERDYDYPLPEKDEMAVVTGVGEKDDLNYLLLGLKGKKEKFENVPPLNVCFCIDRSGSMSGVMPWVKDCFYIFIDSIRDGDTISLVDMNTVAQVLIPPMTVQSKEDREAFKRAVDKVQADGATDVYSGIKKSYEQIELNEKDGHVNRVIILTDGMHNFGEMINQDIINLAKDKRDNGINISTILLGVQAATGLMTDVAEQGGGSSRFISNHDEMVKIFNTELDRMLIPVARDVRMKLTLNDGVKVTNTWNYENTIDGNTVNYYIPTIHNGDYETIFTEVEISDSFKSKEIGTYYISYKDLYGNEKELGPYYLYPVVEDDDKLMKDERVREVEGIVSYTRTLTNIAEKTMIISSLESELYQYENPSAQRDDIVGQINVEVQQNLQLIERIREYLLYIDDSLGGGVYTKYYDVLDSYKETFDNVYDYYNKTEEVTADSLS